MKKVSRGNTSDLIGLWNTKIEGSKANLLQIPSSAGDVPKFRKTSAVVPKTLSNFEHDNNPRFRKSSALVLMPTAAARTETSANKAAVLNVDKSLSPDCYKPMKNVSGLEDSSHLPKLRSILEMPYSPATPQIHMETDKFPRRDSVGLGRSKSVCHPHRVVKFSTIEASDSKDIIRNTTTDQDNTKNDGHLAPRLSRQASLPSLTEGTDSRQQKTDQTKPNGKGLTPVMRSPSSAKEVILAWVQERTNTYPNLNVTNFSSSWNDGMAFCALIHYYYPEAFDYDKLDPKNRRYNFDLAFKAAEHFADICPLLDVEDMVMMVKPDWKCVFTYVQTFYRRFRNGRDPQSPTRKLTLTPPEQTFSINEKTIESTR